MTETTFHNRRAVAIENPSVRVTVTVEGGHIAEILDKATGVNPLWIPPWPSIEPSIYSAALHPGYGGDSESKLLAGIMGHNLCLDLFGGPSAEEAHAGMTVHGESSVVAYDIAVDGLEMVCRASMPVAGLKFERRIRLSPAGCVVQIHETVENVTAQDKPIAWTQHVTLGPPFLEKGATQFRATCTRSKVTETDFSDGKGYMKIGAEFDWPLVPCRDGGTTDMRVFTAAAVSGEFSSHLMDPAREQAYFTAWHPSTKVLAGYVWKQSDFPWLGIWEENHCRLQGPWNGVSLTRGMEFGVSPVPESRREMIDRGKMFGVPGYRWVPAKSCVSASYCAFVTTAPAIPEEVAWDGNEIVKCS
jgi:hypothetical protein